MMVLQFADGGSLHNYLKKSFTSLTWSDKLKITIDITKGLIMCLHSERIVHRDLVRKILFLSMNFFFHQFFLFS